MNDRIALLSNINMNFILRMLKKNFEVYDSEGFGNELGVLLDKNSSYHAFGAGYTFIINDLLEVLEHDLHPQRCRERVNRWFDVLETTLDGEMQYYISDAYLWGVEIPVLFTPQQRQLTEEIWNSRLQELCDAHVNVHVFPYHDLIRELGEENSFSLKMWYMGKILHTNEAQKRIGEKMEHCIMLQKRIPKKVLLEESPENTTPLPLCCRMIMVDWRIRICSV